MQASNKELIHFLTAEEEREHQDIADVQANRYTELAQQKLQRREQNQKEKCLLAADEQSNQRTGTCSISTFGSCQKLYCRKQATEITPVTLE